MSLMRVMHINLGRPLISAEHDPHLPALQFHRTARSLACSAWILCTTSRTTIPSETSVGYSLNSPPLAVVRQILNRTFGMLFHFFDDLLKVGAHGLLIYMADLHASAFVDHAYVKLSVLFALCRKVLAEMTTATFLSFGSR